MTKKEKIEYEILKGLILRRIKELKEDYKRLKEEAHDERNANTYREYAREEALQKLSALNELEDIITLF